MVCLLQRYLIAAKTPLWMGSELLVVTTASGMLFHNFIAQKRKGNIFRRLCGRNVFASAAMGMITVWYNEY